MTRHQANMTLLEILKGYLQANPDIRFGQALLNLQLLIDWDKGLVLNPFYEEPDITLTRVREVYK